MWQDSLGKILGPKWLAIPPGIRDLAYARMGSWMDPEESEYADVILDALANKTPPIPALAQLLGALIQNRAKPEDKLAPLAVQLLARLDDGKLTTKELAEVAAIWLSGHVTSPDLQSFIQLATTLPFDGSDIEAGILNWVHDRANGALDADLRKAIDDREALTTRDLALFLISAFVQSNVLKTGKVDESGVKKALLDALASAAATQKAGPIIGIVKAFLDNKPAQAVLIAVKLFGFTGDDSFIRALLGIGDLKAEIFKRLANIVSSLGVPNDQAQALVTRFFEISEGKVDLFPKQDEKQQIGILSDQGYELWLRWRQVIYSAKQAVAGGAVVPTDAMAKPHVFAAADIAWGTTTMKSQAGGQLALFCKLVSEFAAVEFSEFGKDLTDPDLVTPDLVTKKNPLVSDVYRMQLIPRLGV